MTRRAIFLDRDGVINVNRPDHVKCWDEFVFLPRALDALRKIASSDFLVFVMTNQAAIARGLTTESAVRHIHTQMIAEIEKAGGHIDAVYFCPHHPDEKCGCRKPQPGLYLQAAQQFEIDLAASYVIGDAVADIGAALAIGARPILVLTGRGEEHHKQMQANNHNGYVVHADLMSAVEWIWRAEGLAE
jgi:D-glycero-D-manno-heptose 1,7-bisphosphate phosphatase